MPPVATLGPTIPTNKTQNATSTVAMAATATWELTEVPMTISTLPATANPAWAIALSTRLPPNAANSNVAKLPKEANVAICALWKTSRLNANRDGITIVIRKARKAAVVDQVLRT